MNSINGSDQSFLRSVTRIQERLQRAQLEVSSGKKIFDASDAPDSISALLTVRSQLEANTQLQSNLSRTKAEVDAAEGGLQQAVKVVEKARVLAAQAQSGFNEDGTWYALQQQAGDLTTQVLNIANTNVEGRFIFSGDRDTSQPFTFDPVNNVVSSYNGSANTRQSLAPGGIPFNVGLAGNDIFDSQAPGASVFSALKQLQDAITAKDPAAVQTAMASIETSYQHLSTSLSTYGAVQSRVTDATTLAQKTDTSLRTQLSSIEDADATQAIIEMQTANTNLQAAFEVRGKVPRTSLFDYLG